MRCVTSVHARWCVCACVWYEFFDLVSPQHAQLHVDSIFNGFPMRLKGWASLCVCACVHLYICICAGCVSQNKDCVMREFLHFHAPINNSSVTVWDSNRIKLLSPISPKKVVFIPPSVSPPPPPHSRVSQALCQCAQLLPYWQKNQSHLTPKLPVHVVLPYLGREQTIWTDSSVNFLISPRSLLLFLDILSQRHKRQPLNPTSFQYNNKLTVWQAIMCYYTLSIVRY